MSVKSKQCLEIEPLLAEYVEGLLKPPALNAVREHLAACPTCSVELEGLGEIIKALHSLPPVQAPSEITEKILSATANGSARISVTENQPSLLGRAISWLFPEGIFKPAYAMILVAFIIAGVLLFLPHEAGFKQPAPSVMEESRPEIHKDMVAADKKAVESEPDVAHQKTLEPSEPELAASMEKKSAESYGGMSRQKSLSMESAPGKTMAEKASGAISDSKDKNLLGRESVAGAPPAPREEKAAEKKVDREFFQADGKARQEKEMNSFAAGSPPAPASRPSALPINDSDEMMSMPRAEVVSKSKKPWMGGKGETSQRGAESMVEIRGNTQAGKAVTGSPLTLEKIWKDIYSGILRKGEVAIYSQREFNSLWHRVYAMRIDAPLAPEVDFEKFFIAAAFMGNMPTGGHSINITGATFDGKTLFVHLHVTRPAPGSFVTQQFTQPYSIAVIPKPEEKFKVEFVYE